MTITEAKTVADIRAIMDRVTPIAREVLKNVHLQSPSPVDQAGALIAALAAIIETEVGRDMAPAFMSAMIEPTMIDWQRPAPGETRL